MTPKMGQAGAAAALIAVIAALIVMYIIFLQPDDRADIFGDDFRSSSSSTSRTRNITLLNETPGRIDFLSQRVVDHTIPATYIFTRTAGMVIEEADSLYIKRTVFSSVEKNIGFSITDLANTENILLSFAVTKAKGRLVISLNGEEILNKELTANVQPIELQKRLLKAENVITFSVSSPGAAFWRTNEYALENVQVTADITRTDAQRSRSVFLVSAVEYNNLDRVYFEFLPDCDVAQSGPLDIWINEYNIYSAVPDCGVGRLSLEVPPSHIKSGENELIFRIDQGDYSLSHIKIKSQLKQIDFPVYFFELSEEEYQSVQNKSREVIIRMDFVDTIDRKQGQIIVNGRTTGFDTKELYVEKDITDDVERGDNSVKIKPEKTIDVWKLTVKLVKQG